MWWVTWSHDRDTLSQPILSGSRFNGLAHVSHAHVYLHAKTPKLNTSLHPCSVVEPEIKCYKKKVIMFVGSLKPIKKRELILKDQHFEEIKRSWRRPTMTKGNVSTDHRLVRPKHEDLLPTLFWPLYFLHLNLSYTITRWYYYNN